MIDIGGKLLLLGAGNMGGAMLEGWLKLGLDPAQVAALDPRPPERIAGLISASGVALNPDLSTFGTPAVVLLAVKPQMMEAAMPSIAPIVSPTTLIVSIMAGKTVAGIGRDLPAGIPIVRSMPNLPAAVGRGVTGAFANKSVTPAQKAVAQALLSGIGSVEWVDDEALIDAVTGVSGSGPGYVFYFVEALAKAGVAAGLPEDLAMRLARGTVAGCGEMLHRSSESAESLRKSVMSPNGTTVAGLNVLMGPSGIEPFVVGAVAAATKRAGELAN
ncbi:MAG: pyrroline-5-carboxylate reductase [Labrys sp. (in: a-proteobacteria)]|jgi:pyrroline-5-carboxylate reductase